MGNHVVSLHLLGPAICHCICHHHLSPHWGTLCAPPVCHTYLSPPFVITVCHRHLSLHLSFPVSLRLLHSPWSGSGPALIRKTPARSDGML